MNTQFAVTNAIRNQRRTENPQADADLYFGLAAWITPRDILAFAV
jgi:hypothetical protein